MCRCASGISLPCSFFNLTAIAVVEAQATDEQRVGGFDVDQRMAVKEAGWTEASRLLVVTVTLRDDPQWELVRAEVAGGAPQTVAGPVSGPHAELASIYHLAE